MPPIPLVRRQTGRLTKREQSMAGKQRLAATTNWRSSIGLYEFPRVWLVMLRAFDVRWGMEVRQRLENISTLASASSSVGENNIASRLVRKSCNRSPSQHSALLYSSQQAMPQLTMTHTRTGSLLDQMTVFRTHANVSSSN